MWEVDKPQLGHSTQLGQWRGWDRGDSDALVGLARLASSGHWDGDAVVGLWTSTSWDIRRSWDKDTVGTEGAVAQLQEATKRVLGCSTQLGQ